MVKLIDPNEPDRPRPPPGESGRPQLHYIGDIPKATAAVEVCRMAAVKTGWKIIFIPDHPDHPPNRISVWTQESFGNQRPFWEAFENIMKSMYGDDEGAWPQAPEAPDLPPPRSTKRYYHS